MKIRIFTVLSIFFLFPFQLFSQTDSLQVLSVNVWSGLDYDGMLKMGEYETVHRREQRFRLLVSELKVLSPDLVFLQEANPVGSFASRLADSLGYDEVHQSCNAGVKIGNVGLPSNLKEGNVILAKKYLKLEKFDAWKLSGAVGINGDLIDFHINESIYALCATVKIQETQFFLVNVHLYAGLPEDSSGLKRLQRSLSEGRISEDEYDDAVENWNDGIERQRSELKTLANRLEELPRGMPVIIGGDFNMGTDSKALRNFISKKRFINTQSNFNQYTWDPANNINIKLQLAANSKSEEDASDILENYFDSTTKNIDHILLGKPFNTGDVISSNIVMDKPAGGTQVSDHYGYMCVVRTDSVIKKVRSTLKKYANDTRSSIDVLPIVNYDTDAGFGYGVKFFALNKLKKTESFDVILFNSTKGERWYRLAASLPDADLRQGTLYNLSADLVIDYDRWLNSNYFGPPSESSYENKKTFTKQTLTASLMFGHAFSRPVVIQIGAAYKEIKSSENSTDDDFLKGTENQRTLSVISNVRFDTRNSFLNPSSGVLLMAEGEFAPRNKLTNVPFTRAALKIHTYNVLFYPKSVFAARFSLEQMWGNEIPFQSLLSLGGNSTLRGYAMDRFTGKSSALFNAELRFPIIWRFGGIAGVDAGKTWESLSKFDLKNWAVNSIVGLRFDMNTFIVRLDVGFSKETTGLYLNFGHIF